MIYSEVEQTTLMTNIVQNESARAEKEGNKSLLIQSLADATLLRLTQCVGVLIL